MQKLSFYGTVKFIKGNYVYLIPNNILFGNVFRAQVHCLCKTLVISLIIPWKSMVFINTKLDYQCLLSCSSKNN